MAYRFYITDTMKAINENLASLAGGPCMSARYADIVYPKNTDDRSGDEIAADIIKKLREGASK